MRTIPKNTKRAREVLAKARNVKCYTLSNCFTGTPLGPDPIDPEAWMKRKPGDTVVDTTPQGYLAAKLRMFQFSKLIDEGRGKYHLRVTSNEWYEFEV